MAKRKGRKPKVAANDEPAVNQFAAQHGDYRSATVVDLTGELGGKRQSMVRVVKNHSLVDRWLTEGGCGFEEPQARAIDHVRDLWKILDTQAPRVVANYASGLAANVRGGDGCTLTVGGYIDALRQLGEYQAEIPSGYWITFEAIVRHDVAAGAAGEHLARHPVQRIAAAKNTVGFVASKIAEWRGY